MLEFIYDTNNKQPNLEFYLIYDYANKDVVYDVTSKKSTVVLDRENKLIYFLNMETEEHWILEKHYFPKLIKEFLANAKHFACENYEIVRECSGGSIYYKYVKGDN